MTPEQFKTQLERIKNQIQELVTNKLPRMAAKYAVDHFRENFQLGGFVNGGLDKWKAPGRYDAEGRSAGEKYGALLSARKELYNSINYTIENGQVIISSDKEYSQIHNEGGQIPITKKMKGFAWYKHKQTKQKDSMWKGIALTKKTAIVMPKRQFIGESKELDQKIEKLIETQINKLFQ